MRGKGKVYVTTLSDTDSSNSDSEESYDGEGNYSAFIAIAPVQSLDDLNLLVEELWGAQSGVNGDSRGI